jgi:hypothetical protein
MYKSSQPFHLSTSLIGVLAALVVVGMLLIFHAVVQGAVQDGESRRQAGVTQAAATWRCSLLRDLRARDICLLQTDVVITAIPSGVMHASALN